MKQSGSTEEQIISILKENESGVSASQLLRHHVWDEFSEVLQMEVNVWRS